MNADAVFLGFVIVATLVALHRAHRLQGEVTQLRALARAWRTSFTEYLAADLAGDEVEKLRIATVVGRNVDALEAAEMTRARRGWWAR